MDGLQDLKRRGYGGGRLCFPWAGLPRAGLHLGVTGNGDKNTPGLSPRDLMEGVVSRLMMGVVALLMIFQSGVSDTEKETEDATRCMGSQHHSPPCPAVEWKSAMLLYQHRGETMPARPADAEALVGVAMDRETPALSKI